MQTNNKKTITICSIIALIILIVFTSLLINYRRKEIKDVVKNVSDL